MWLASNSFIRAKATMKPTAAHLRHPKIISSIPADASAGKGDAQAGVTPIRQPLQGGPLGKTSLVTYLSKLGLGRINRLLPDSAARQRAFQMSRSGLRVRNGIAIEY